MQHSVLIISIIFLCTLALFALWLVSTKYRLYQYFKRQNSQAKQQFLQINNINIHYQIHGAGKRTLVCLHGIGASLYIWRFVVPILSKNYKLILLDLPGFGLSSKKLDYSHGLEEQAFTVDSFLQKLKVDQCILIGSSMGGAIALWMAKKFPQRYKYVIASSPATNPRIPQRLPLHLLLPFYKGLKFFINEVSMRQILKLVVQNKNLITKESINAYLLPYSDSGESLKCFALAFNNLLKDPRLPHTLSQLEAEVVLLWGKKDKLTPIQYATELQQTIPKSYVKQHEKAGHHIMEDDPQWFCQQIDEFINTKVLNA